MKELLTFISRSTDGLILCESWDDSDPSLISVKQEAKKLLQSLKNAPSRCVIDSKNVVFFYIIEFNTVFLTCTTKNFNKQKAFSFLEEISKLFQEEIQRLATSSGLTLQSYVDGITKPYFFITFDRTIQKKKKELESAPNAMASVTTTIQEVNQIMRKSLDEMLQRGEALEDVGRKADDLKAASMKFAKQAKIANLKALMRDYGAYAAIVAVFLLVFYFAFF
jgi:vesicle transport protein SEC22